jgi:hypothetical protein
VQKRVNAYVRSILVAAERSYYGGSFKCVSESLTNSDTELLQHQNKWAATQQLCISDFGDFPVESCCICSTMVPKRGLRTNICRITELFGVEADTASACSKFLCSLQTHRVETGVHFSTLEYKRQLQLRELKEYLNLTTISYLDCIITPQMVISGLSSCALHFIASDEICQKFVASYLHAKIQLGLTMLLPDAVHVKNIDEGNQHESSCEVSAQTSENRVSELSCRAANVSAGGSPVPAADPQSTGVGMSHGVEPDLDAMVQKLKPGTFCRYYDEELDKVYRVVVSRLFKGKLRLHMQLR